LGSRDQQSRHSEADAKAEAGSDYYMSDDVEETPEGRIEDFHEHLIRALEEHIEDLQTTPRLMN
jgi:hypothetical protein